LHGEKFHDRLRDRQAFHGHGQPSLTKRKLEG
jgi:hypothetical protein